MLLPPASVALLQVHLIEVSDEPPQVDEEVEAEDEWAECHE